MFYWSGNRDEAAFEEPFKFKVDRNVSKHVAFGYGVHLCLGMHLARMEIKALYNELLPRLKSIELTGTPKNTLANFVSGLKTLPVRYQFAVTNPLRHGRPARTMTLKALGSASPALGGWRLGRRPWR